MKDMWRMRAPPIPLDYDAILDERFEGRPTNGTTTNRPPPETEQLNSKGTSNGVAPLASSASTSQGNIKDQRALSLKDNLELFVSRCALIVLVSALCLIFLEVRNGWRDAFERERKRYRSTRMTTIHLTLLPQRPTCVRMRMV